MLLATGPAAETLPQARVRALTLLGIRARRSLQSKSLTAAYAESTRPNRTHPEPAFIPCMERLGLRLEL